MGLEEKKSPLYTYIVTEILKPAGLELDEVYATNLIKCRFPNNQTPRDISKRHGMSMKEFLAPFWHNCERWFRQEVREIHPKIVLSFGEPAHQLLAEGFCWNVSTRIKEAFGNIYEVRLLGENVHYAPCIHINSRGHEHYKKQGVHWNTFIQNLRKVVDSVSVT